MGQLAVKFKEWREKLELSHEKTKHGKYTQFYLPFTVFNTSLMHNFILLEAHPSLNHASVFLS